MKTTNSNRSGRLHSFNPSFWEVIPVGEFHILGNTPFYVKNEADEPVMCMAQGADMSAAIETKIYSGWNPELYISITCPVGVTTLKYGF